MGMGHVPQDPLRRTGEGGDVQGRQRRRVVAPRGVAGDDAPRLSAAARGRWAEGVVARWYEREGFQIVARNWRCPVGEVDIIASRGRLVVFCEVKARASDRYGSPAHAVGPDKQRRLRRLAAAWLHEHRSGGVDVRFDVATVTGTRVEVIPAAF